MVSWNFYRILLKLTCRAMLWLTVCIWRCSYLQDRSNVKFRCAYFKLGFHIFCIGFGSHPNCFEPVSQIWQIYIRSMVAPTPFAKRDGRDTRWDVMLWLSNPTFFSCRKDQSWSFPRCLQPSHAVPSPPLSWLWCLCNPSSRQLI